MLDLVFEQVTTNGDRNFGYLIGDRNAREALIVDPSFRPEYLVRRAEVQDLKVKLILNTHGHPDHTSGNLVAKRLTGAKVAIFEDSLVPHDLGLKEGDAFKFGQFSVKVLYTPGHAPDHVVFYFPELEAAITGDHLFVGKIGGTVTLEESKQQYDALRRLVDDLPLSTTIWPGHDFGARPSSTLSLELKSNPFLQATSFEEFLEVKENWREIKNKNALL
ncbi:hydroxyacylglutathione hydrolase family protein [Criblamydia sequanensis]|uniref:Beta-lactamase n=1 Tax=Candidatus Criblamydia sequanensis CRIB-18 TaxID=1437425 RepID=A0A090CYM6_9BACT|nr:hydroxyacylglutathione hydrolase family protein [Criblamydia sequanensis]CDR33586.1 Beta-lactamase [Criblamydia sequanensis CRIB-18]